MALTATIFKAHLNIVDVDRNYYHAHSMTVAQHPSETNERMMVRLLAFALHADEALQFAKGLSTDDEPALWQKTYTDEIELWVELGNPDEKIIRKACGRARQVYVYTYQPRSAQIWWEQNRNKFERFENLTVRHLSGDCVNALTEMAERSMDLQCMIQDGQVTISSPSRSVEIGWLD